MQKNKIILIQLWLGEIPDYFWFHYETTKNLKNVDFLILTNNDNITINSKNYKIVKINPKELENKVSNMLDYKYEISNYKKINDLKSCYGELFENYIKDYEYFGFYDIDTLFGDFEKWIFPHIPNYDVISFADSIFHNRLGGPLTIIRNTYEFRRLYRKKIERFKEILNNDNIDAFEEQELTEILFNNCNVKLIYDCVNCETDNGGKNSYNCYWSGGQVFVNGEEKLLYHFYRKKHTKFTKIGNMITANYDKKFVDDFYWVVCFTENYEKYFFNLLESIKKYSNRKCIVYSINYNFILPIEDLGNEQFIIKRIDIPEGDKDIRGRDHNIISCKPLINLNAINSFPNSKFVSIDSDIYFTANSDNIQKYFELLENYPLINSHIHDVFYISNIRKDEEWTSPLHVLLYAMDYHEEPVYPRRKTNVLIFDEKSKWFFEKQMEIYEKYKKTEPGILLFFDEDTANAILSINKLNKCLPLLDIEEVDDINMDIFSNYSYNMTPISPSTKIPKNKNEVLFFHGIKSQEHYDRIKNNYDKKVIDAEEFVISYSNNTIFFERNSFMTTKKFNEMVNFRVCDLNGSILYELSNQYFFNYGIFYMLDLELSGKYLIKIVESTTDRCIFNDILEVI